MSRVPRGAPEGGLLHDVPNPVPGLPRHTPTFGALRPGRGHHLLRHPRHSPGAGHGGHHGARGGECNQFYVTTMQGLLTVGQFTVKKNVSFG